MRILCFGSVLELERVCLYEGAFYKGVNIILLQFFKVIILVERYK